MEHSGRQAARRALHGGEVIGVDREAALSLDDGSTVANEIHALEVDGLGEGAGSGYRQAANEAAHRLVHHVDGFPVRSGDRFLERLSRLPVLPEEEGCWL